MLLDNDVLTTDGRKVLGEYQIALEKITYDVCMDDGTYQTKPFTTLTNDSRICAMNFPVSDGFILHKTAFDTVTNTDLSNYITLDGSKVASPSLYQTVAGGEVQYQGTAISTLARDFAAEKQEIAKAFIPRADLPFVIVDTVNGPE